ncbi:hypothetical protein K6119_01890 [Paracrocinitomix mangrovi]|uniref:toxin-antitoxin system YwqK family antitoxin n=1 Tax=Paracrocinitomix mangrovi TaxID=2862509 RepID=UPI001C8DA39C|nr:hypothetical protein [Paracrocinitomix mangrovi]UKN02269.1 hypothetical protein K6119_01890 [Paracrocinitomix mangrovi]
MIKLVALVFFLFIIKQGFAQEQKDKYYPNSSILKESGSLDINGYPVGQWKYYLQNGNITYTINWDTNYLRTYYENGNLKEEGTFIPDTGTHIGKWIVYDEDGKIISEKTFNENGIEITSKSTTK